MKDAMLLKVLKTKVSNKKLVWTHLYIIHRQCPLMTGRNMVMCNPLMNLFFSPRFYLDYKCCSTPLFMYQIALGDGEDMQAVGDSKKQKKSLCLMYLLAINSLDTWLLLSSDL